MKGGSSTKSSTISNGWKRGIAIQKMWWVGRSLSLGSSNFGMLLIPVVSCRQNTLIVFRFLHSTATVIGRHS